MTDFAEKLRKAREAKELSKTEMARFLDLSLTAYSLYEKGERKPNLGNLQKIAEILEVSVDELLAPNSKVEPTKELHIHLDYYYTCTTITNFMATVDMISKDVLDVINTTQPHFCSWKYVNMGYRLFVHKGGHMIELKIGKNPSTDRLLKGTENLERLLLGGEFDFVKGDVS